jgi:hypothetical protein
VGASVTLCDVIPDAAVIVWGGHSCPPPLTCSYADWLAALRAGRPQDSRQDAGATLGLGHSTLR